MSVPVANHLVTRWWWVRHAPMPGPPGMIHPPEAAPEAIAPERVEPLRRILPKRALWLTSGWERTTATARALTLTRPLPTPTLAEQDFGRWTGRTHEAIAEADPDAQAVFWADPDGESFAEQCARVAAVIEQVNQEHAGLDLVAIAHAGTIRAACAHALELTPKQALSFVIDPLSLTRIDWIGDAARIVAINRV
jgi:alpha-ribazole phosphatase